MEILWLEDYIKNAVKAVYVIGLQLFTLSEGILLFWRR